MPAWASLTGDGGFTLPVVPDSLTAPRARLNYTLEHLWDHWAFADTTAMNWSASEEGFAEFVRLLQYADSSTAQRIVQRYIGQGFAKKELRTKYESLIDTYLGDPHSPLRNDVVYACFLKNMLPCYDLETETAQRERTTYRLSVVTKNQPGTMAADFEFTNRQGRHGQLRQLQGDLIVVVFHDPDCEKCQLLLPQLLQEPRLQRKGITVLAMAPEGDTARWKQEERTVPANWIDAYSPQGEMMKQQLYSLPVLPSIYLLDSQHRVLMKDVEPQVLMHILDEYERRKPSSR